MKKQKEFAEALMKVMKVAAEQGIKLQRISPYSFWLDVENFELPAEKLLGVSIDPV